MSLRAGIVGLPNVGKSTLFNAITRAGAGAENYPFCTIEPNVGVVEVPDERLQQLAGVVDPAQVIPAAYEFVDIAGLVEGASKGEGLGNKFLSHIREVDAICHVVRCFEDTNVTHVSGSVDPLRDIEIINLELALADLSTIGQRLEKVTRTARSGDETAAAEKALLERLEPVLSGGEPARSLSFNEQEQAFLKSYNLLTSKPVLYVANVAEEDLADPSSNEYVQAVAQYASRQGDMVVTASARVESELVELDEVDRRLFLDELGLDAPGLDRMIRATYDLLGLITYFTAGPKEVRAWTIRQGLKAPAAAGVIHSDFERGFIRAEVISCEELVAAGSYASAREQGLVRLEGKDYTMQDGDVAHFRFNVS